MNENIKSQIEYFATRLAMMDDEELTAKDEQAIAWIMSSLGPSPKIALLEKLLTMYKDSRNNIVRSDLPLALAEAGLTAASVEGGIEVSVSTFYETKQLDKEKVASWLEANQYGDIIKDTLLLPKGAYTAELDTFLNENHIDFKRDSTINGNQLKSVVRKHIEAGGNPPPAEAMEVRSFVQAVIKKEKVSM